VSGPRQVEIRRRLPAPVSEVFRWWPEADRLAEWMSPVGSIEAQVDLRVGGAFHITMKSEGTVIEHAGEYLEIDPPRRLVFSWSSAYTGPGPSHVTVELEPDAEGATLLRLVHSELPDAVADSHRGGWGKMLDRLATQLFGTGIVGAKEEL
jgi:uncharacterized protein YndB with AHSA1/START domain